VASADLSHAGPQFGDNEPVTEEFLARIEASDRAALEVALTRNADDLFHQVQKGQNRTRICGLAAIYTMLSVTDAREAELLNYGQTTQPTGNLVVSFCSMVFR
jgi:AmmeMemoRadiSam system protein B